MLKTFFLLIVLFFSISNADMIMMNLQTGSMPCFQEDKFVQVSRVPFQDLRIGDVVCYRPPITYTFLKYAEISPLARAWVAIANQVGNVCHRIVYRDEKNIVVKADVSNIPDPFLIKQSDYLWKIWTKKCYVKTVKV